MERHRKTNLLFPHKYPNECRVKVLKIEFIYEYLITKNFNLLLMKIKF